MSIQYRTLRADNSLPVKEGTPVTVNAHHEIEWDAANHTVKNPKRTLVVRGNMTDKAQIYPVEWKFQVSDEDFKQIEAGIIEVRTAVREPAGMFTPPLEREIRMDVLPWLRVGFIFTQSGHSGYFEFKHEGQKLRAVVNDIPAMEHFRQFLVR